MCHVCLPTRQMVNESIDNFHMATTCHWLLKHFNSPINAECAELVTTLNDRSCLKDFIGPIEFNSIRRLSDTVINTVPWSICFFNVSVLLTLQNIQNALSSWISHYIRVAQDVACFRSHLGLLVVFQWNIYRETFGLISDWQIARCELTDYAKRQFKTCNLSINIIRPRMSLCQIFQWALIMFLIWNNFKSPFFGVYQEFSFISLT